MAMTTFIQILDIEFGSPTPPRIVATYGDGSSPYEERNAAFKATLQSLPGLSKDSCRIILMQYTRQQDVLHDFLRDELAIDIADFDQRHLSSPSVAHALHESRPHDKQVPMWCLKVDSCTRQIISGLIHWRFEVWSSRFRFALDSNGKQYCQYFLSILLDEPVSG